MLINSEKYNFAILVAATPTCQKVMDYEPGEKFR